MLPVEALRRSAQHIVQLKSELDVECTAVVQAFVNRPSNSNWFGGDSAEEWYAAAKWYSEIVESFVEAVAPALPGVAGDWQSDTVEVGALVGGEMDGVLVIKVKEKGLSAGYGTTIKALIYGRGGSSLLEAGQNNGGVSIDIELGIELLPGCTLESEMSETMRDEFRPLVLSTFFERPKKGVIEGKMLAFAMSSHKRLGEKSLARGLAADVLDMIQKQVVDSVVKPIVWNLE